MRCRQSRWQHNKGRNPLIRITSTVQINRATSESEDVVSPPNYAVTYSDKKLCNFALSGSKSPNARPVNMALEWDANNLWVNHVAEAKSRLLTPEKCAELLGLQVSATGSTTPLETSGSPVLAQKLLAIKSLLDQELITEDEAAEKRKRLLSEY